MMRVYTFSGHLSMGMHDRGMEAAFRLSPNRGECLVFNFERVTGFDACVAFTLAWEIRRHPSLKFYLIAPRRAVWHDMQRLVDLGKPCSLESIHRMGQ